ncbi:MAG TPA: PhoH family protein, partial [Candidatus Enterococcus stercoravium]|nr:PhoH family protein [Candidatus Enterococcus stercoravium]
MTEERQTLQMKLTESDDIAMLLGAHDKNLKLIEENTDTVIRARGEVIQIEGSPEATDLAKAVIEAIQELIKRGINISTPDVVSALKMGKQKRLAFFIAMYEEEIVKDRNGKPIRVKNAGQKTYVESVKKHDVVFGIGPAGTGKTFLAVVMA